MCPFIKAACFVSLSAGSTRNLELFTRFMACLVRLCEACRMACNINNSGSIKSFLFLPFFAIRNIPSSAVVFKAGLAVKYAKESQHTGDITKQTTRTFLWSWGVY